MTILPLITAKKSTCNNERSSNRYSDILHEEIWYGAEISNIDNAIMSSTASNGMKGVYFKNVPENSAAYKLGLRTNDVVKRVDDADVEDITSFKLQMYKFKEQNVLNFCIHRLGRLQQVECKHHQP